jgi:hypothetical protein
MPSLQIEVDEQIYQNYITANPFQKQHIKKLVEEALQLLSPHCENPVNLQNEDWKEDFLSIPQLDISEEEVAIHSWNIPKF